MHYKIFTLCIVQKCGKGMGLQGTQSKPKDCSLCHFSPFSTIGVQRAEGGEVTKAPKGEGRSRRMGGCPSSYGP